MTANTPTTTPAPPPPTTENARRIEATARQYREFLTVAFTAAGFAPLPALEVVPVRNIGASVFLPGHGSVFFASPDAPACLPGREMFLNFGTTAIPLMQFTNPDELAGFTLETFFKAVRARLPEPDTLVRLVREKNTTPYPVSGDPRLAAPVAAELFVDLLPLAFTAAGVAFFPAPPMLRSVNHCRAAVTLPGYGVAEFGACGGNPYASGTVNLNGVRGLAVGHTELYTVEAIARIVCDTLETVVRVRTPRPDAIARLAAKIT